MDIALFSPSSLFADCDGNSSDEESKDAHQNFVERKHQFAGIELIIREFSFHQLNANLLWPGTFAFAEWLVQNRPWMEGRRVLELGSGTGALAIFLHKAFKFDITTSDYDDPDIEENIAHNCRVNGVSPIFPHLRLCFFPLVERVRLVELCDQHSAMLPDSWGDIFPTHNPDWDLVIASDILLYVKQYSNLIKTLSFLLKSYKPKVSKEVPSSTGANDSCPLPRPAFLMSWRRRIGKEDESLFFDGCDKAGLQVQHLGLRVYCITPREMTNKETAQI